MKLVMRIVAFISINSGRNTIFASPVPSSAVAWGSSDYGGDASAVDLTNVADISCGGPACVARKNDGSAVAWGSSDWGGDASAVDLTNIATRTESTLFRSLVKTVTTNVADISNIGEVHS